jgi:hypothetical protein
MIGLSVVRIEGCCKRLGSSVMAAVFLNSWSRLRQNVLNTSAYFTSTKLYMSVEHSVD